MRWLMRSATGHWQMIVLERLAATMVVVLAATWMPHSYGQASASVTLQPLSDTNAADLYRRVPGCRAVIVESATAQTIAVVAQVAWAMVQTSRGALEAPVVFRDRGDKGPELRFSVTDAALGGSLSGTVSQSAAGRHCSFSSGCMEIPARLTLTLLGSQSDARPVFDSAVTVVDYCATDPHRRVFKTVSWWERILRLLSSS